MQRFVTLLGRVSMASNVDKTDTVTLVLEFSRNRKDSPAVIFALIFLCWGANSWANGYSVGADPNY